MLAGDFNADLTDLLAIFFLLIGFGLFDLRYKTWDHSTTALPLLRVYDLLKMLIVKMQYEFALMANIVIAESMLS